VERQIFYEVKANLRRNQVEMLRRAGITWLQPGSESLHSGVLELMDKGVQAWQNVQLLKACRELGVRLSWNFLWGFPGEDDGWYAEMASWLPALEHLQPPSGVIRVRFDRFSPYHQRPGKFGLSLQPRPARPAAGAPRPARFPRRHGGRGSKAVGLTNQPLPEISHPWRPDRRL
jgi:hypothetical protein